MQSFHPPTSLRDFYRFIRIDFHSHYGNEYYCPVSLLHVYGLTHLEEWKWDVWEAESVAKLHQKQKEAEAIIPFDEASTTTAVEAKVVMHDVPSNKTETLAHRAITIEPRTTDSVTRTSSPEEPQTTIVLSESSGVNSALSPSSNGFALTADLDYLLSTLTCESQNIQENIQSHTSVHTLHGVKAEIIRDSPPIPPSIAASSHQTQLVHPKLESPDPISRSSEPAISSFRTIETTTEIPTSITNIIHPDHTSRPSSSPTVTHTPSIPVPHPVPPISTGGESIYRTIMNRLTALEANHTLYMRYVEAQTASVREVLKRLGEDLGRVEAIVSVSLLTLHDVLKLITT